MLYLDLNIGKYDIPESLDKILNETLLGLEALLWNTFYRKHTCPAFQRHNELLIKYLVK